MNESENTQVLPRIKEQDELERSEKGQGFSGEVGGREGRDYWVEIATALGVGAVWRCRPIQQSMSETLAPKDFILYCPVKVERDLITFS